MIRSTNISEKKRQTVREFQRLLEENSPEDEVEFSLSSFQIETLLEANLIYPEPSQNWFDKIFWSGMQFRVRSGFGYPEVKIFKQSMRK